MFDIKKITIVSLIVVVVSVPFIFREKTASIVPDPAAETLSIITAHNEALRREYTIGFKKWYKARTGKNVNIDWRYQGGGRDAARYIESMYANSFRLLWENELHRPWNAETIAVFNTRSEKQLKTKKDDDLQYQVTRAFFDSNISCGIDLLFGGGIYEFIVQSAKGNLVPCPIIHEKPELFSDDTIPQTLSGDPLWDAQGRWFGGSLSAFGIIYNQEAIIEDQIAIFPKTWMDIGRPEFYKKLAIVDPTKSSSTQKAFVMLIQQQMQLCYNDILKEKGSPLSNEEELRAVHDGWIEGLRLIQKIVANGRYFTESATRPIVDVSAGNCLAGIAVDFYGAAEAKHLEDRSGSKRFKFVMPVGGGAPSADPLGVFRGAPNPKLAQDFIEFIVSEEGQKLLDFNTNTPGGPAKTTMRRMPILKTIYDPKNDAYRCDPSINPYASAADFVSHPEWTNPIFNLMGRVIKLAFLDPNIELGEAMGAIINAQKEGRTNDAERAYKILSNMDIIQYEIVAKEMKAITLSKDILKIADYFENISEHFRKQYLEALNVANGR